MSYQEDRLTEIASAIRTKKGTPGTIQATEFTNQILSIPTGIDTSDATATASTIRSGYTAYAKGSKITGTYVPPSYSNYTGPYSVTPSTSAQTLYTAGYYLYSNISIDAAKQMSFMSAQSTSSSNIITINCGFKPDYVIYSFASGGVGYIGYTTSPTVTYTTQSTNADLVHTYSAITRTSTGATITSKNKSNNAWPSSNVVVSWWAFGGIT